MVWGLSRRAEGVPRHSMTHRTPAVGGVTQGCDRTRMTRFFKTSWKKPPGAEMVGLGATCCSQFTIGVFEKVAYVYGVFIKHYVSVFLNKHLDIMLEQSWVLCLGVFT